VDVEGLARFTNDGNARLMAGAVDEAIDAYRRALAIDAKRPEALFGLGVALSMRDARDDVAGAVVAFRAAIASGLETLDVFARLGTALARDGRPREAIDAHRRALAIDPRLAAVRCNLGNALGDATRTAEAIDEYRAALAIDPRCVQAHFGLFAALFDDGPSEGEACLRRAIEARPDHGSARFHLGALLTLRGERENAAALLEGQPDHLRTSLDHVVTHPARLFTDGFRLLDFALSEASVDGLVLEFGVRHGTSIDFIAARAGERTVHGFDSFEGLPEAWGALPTGAYSTHGRIPEVASNVTLHAGWFADTLAPFVASHEGPVRFMNVDCDLYSSTREVFAAFGSRLVDGSVVVFDEYLCNPGWQDEEHRALVEASREFSFEWEHLAFSLFTKQAAIRVRRGRSPRATQR
jgi:Tfp pilus assembly protein PilF